jgi:CRISPR-associated protein Csb2
LDPSGPDIESGLDDFEQEVGAGGSASAVHSFQGRFAPTLDKTLSQDAIELEKDSPTVARYSIGGQAPRLTDALLLGERIHLALVELSDGASIFTGCDESGSPLKGHSHAFILSESNMTLGKGRNGEITHVTIYAPARFGFAEVSALEDLMEVQGSGLYVQLNLLGLGRPEDFGGLDLSRGRSPLFAESRSWISRTPFIPTRHPKFTRAGVPKRDASGLQIGSPEHELRRLLELGGFPAPVAVDSVSCTMLGDHKVPWSVFLRQRGNGEGRKAANGAGYGFRIEFPEPVRGPVAVGYGAHFGMGVFWPGNE